MNPVSGVNVRGDLFFVGKVQLPIMKRARIYEIHENKRLSIYFEDLDGKGVLIDLIRKTEALTQTMANKLHTVGLSEVKFFVPMAVRRHFVIFEECFHFYEQKGAERSLVNLQEISNSILGKKS
ncbi:MAG: hypothetical protein JSS32_07680 [Verrucomicrobia bacterium]|nr:hypothetical protein [Verrucomicrobiota bacterium]